MLNSQCFREPALIAGLLVLAGGSLLAGCRERVVEVEKREVHVDDRRGPLERRSDRPVKINVDVKAPGVDVNTSGDRPVAP